MDTDSRKRFIVSNTAMKMLPTMQILSTAAVMGPDGPEGGHKTWVKSQGSKTNQGPTAAKTMMIHSLNKEASQLLCDAVRCLVEDGDAPKDDWKTPQGRSLPADRFWTESEEAFCLASYDAGPCMGIRINICERGKVCCCILLVN